MYSHLLCQIFVIIQSLSQWDTNEVMTAEEWDELFRESNSESDFEGFLSQKLLMVVHKVGGSVIHE